MRLDAYSVVFLRRPAGAPRMSDTDLESLQQDHLAFNARMREAGHAVQRPKSTTTSRQYGP
jgi:hypothetical protein